MWREVVEMVINGKIVTWKDCITKRNPGDYVWVAYDNSKARLPVAIAESGAELARIMGVSASAVHSTASKLSHGVLAEPRFARVYIGGTE